MAQCNWASTGSSPLPATELPGDFGPDVLSQRKLLPEVLSEETRGGSTYICHYLERKTAFKSNK